MMIIFIPHRLLNVYLEFHKKFESERTHRKFVILTAGWIDTDHHLDRALASALEEGLEHPTKL